MERNEDGLATKDRRFEHAEAAVSKLWFKARFRRQQTPRQQGSYAWKVFVSLDGTHPTYTTFVLITMNLGLLVWFFERGLLEGRNENDFFLSDFDRGIAETRLIRSLILIILAMLNGFAAFLMLTMNMRDVQTLPTSVAKRWLFCSAVGLVLWFAGGVLVLYDAEQAYQWRIDRGSYEKPFPHYMLLSFFAFFLFCTNVLYIRTIYLPFVQHRVTGWEFVRRNLPAIIDLGRWEKNQVSMLERVGRRCMWVINRLMHFFNALLFHYFQFFENIIQLCLRAYEREGSRTAMKQLSRKVSDLSLLPFRFLRWSPLIQIPLCILRSSKGFFKSMLCPFSRFVRVARAEGGQRFAPWYKRVFRGVLRVVDRFVLVFLNLKPEVQRMANDLWDSVKEDKTYKHSSWLKAASVTAVIMLLYWSVFLANEFRGYMDDVYRPTRNCMIHNPGVSNFFLRFIGFSPSNENSELEDEVTENVCAYIVTSLEVSSTSDQVSLVDDPFVAVATGAASPEVAALTEFSQELTDRMNQNFTEDRFYKCETGERETDVCIMLAAVNLANERLAEATGTDREPSDEFFDSFSGEMVYLFDVIMRTLDSTIWVGLGVGLAFGCWTLLSVMGQYKRLSLAIRSGLFTDFDMERQYELCRSLTQKQGILKRVDSVITTNSFVQCIAHYPMSTSIFFSGMLISTAILQLVVFGALVSIAVAFVVAMGDDKVFTIVKPLLWMLLAFAVTWLVNGPIATMVIGEGLLVANFHVIHETLFLMFLLVLTSVHLVVSVFLAFFRMLWVVLTSLVTINRLDKNLFPLYKERDIGHKSFMAMILMQHVFHMNHSQNEEERSSWAMILRQLEEADVRATLQGRQPSCPVIDEGGQSQNGEAEIMEQGQSAYCPLYRLRKSRTDVAERFDFERRPTT